MCQDKVNEGECDTPAHTATDLSLSLLLWLLFLHRARQKFLKVPAHPREEISRHSPVFINFTDTVMNLNLLC